MYKNKFEPCVIKRVLIVFVLFYQGNLFSQNAKVKLYGHGSILIKRYSQVGGGLVIGGTVSDFGIGVGADFYKVSNSLRGSAIPFFLDIRYINNRNKIKPFAAVHLGKFIWKGRETKGTNLVNSTWDYKGKFIIGAETGIWLSKKLMNNGVQFSIGIRNCISTTTLTINSYLTPAGIPGPLSQTIGKPYNSSFLDYFLRIGYKF